MAALALLVLFAATGCYSHKPVGTGYEAQRQHKMQSAAHWQVLASDVAEQIVFAVEKRDDLLYRPIFIQDPANTDFSRGFYELLKSELVKRGQVVSVFEEDSLIADVKVMGVRHEKGENAWMQDMPPGSYAALPFGMMVLRSAASSGWSSVLLSSTLLGGAFDMTRGYFQGFPEHEVIVTTELTYNNKYVVHTSDIYYLDEQTLPVYAEKPASEVYAPSTIAIVAE